MKGCPITDDQKQAFLANLRGMPNVTRAARQLGLSPKSFRTLKKADAEFSAAWDEALEEGIENAEAEVHRRAFHGIDKPLTHQGHFTYLRDFDAIDPLTEERFAPHLAPVKRDAQGNPIIATTKEYSDQLATFLLKAHRPERYRERQDITVSGTIDVATRIMAARKRSGSSGT